MKTRFAVATVAVMLAVAPACKRTKDNNLSDAIRNVPRMVEPMRADVMGDPVPKPVEKVPPKPGVVETHRADVMTTTPQPVQEDPLKKVPKIKMVGPSKEEIPLPVGPSVQSPYRGSR